MPNTDFETYILWLPLTPALIKNLFVKCNKKKKIISLSKTNTIYFSLQNLLSVVYFASTMFWH